MKRSYFAVAGALLSLASAAYSSDFGGYMGVNCPKPLTSSILSSSSATKPAASAGNWLYGIDVSEYQKSINWDTVKTVKDFAIMKATEGTYYVDKYIHTNQNGSRRVGILRGYYHFARPDMGNTGTAEADYFLSTIGAPQIGEVLMLDYEPGTNPSDVPGWCKTFLDRIYARTGIKPWIYLNQSQVNSFNWTSIINAGYGLALADPDGVADPTSPVIKWPFNADKQYSWTGTVSGISGGVDMDVFNGDMWAFEAYGTGPVPTITSQPQSQTVCSGNSATFSITATCTGPLSYQWRLNGTNIGGANLSSYTAYTAGSYDCVVTGVWDPVTSNAATLTINAPPVITTNPTNKQVPFGGTATFTVAATGPSLSYQWRRNRSDVTGAITASYTTGNPGNYDCVVSDSCGSVTSNAAGLAINNATWVATVAAAKLLPDGTIVGLSLGPAVTRSLDSLYYLEDSNRSCAIRVNPSQSNVVPEDDVAIVYGQLATVNGERALNNGLMNSAGATKPISAIAMNGGAAAKPLAQGLYVRMCGVAGVAPGATNLFTLNDGSSAPITVMLYGVALPANGANVNVRGVIGQEASGPVLRVTKSTDIW